MMMMMMNVMEEEMKTARQVQIDESNRSLRSFFSSLAAAGKRTHATLERGEEEGSISRRKIKRDCFILKKCLFFFPLRVIVQGVCLDKTKTGIHLKKRERCGWMAGEICHRRPVCVCVCVCVEQRDKKNEKRKESRKEARRENLKTFRSFVFSRRASL